MGEVGKLFYFSAWFNLCLIFTALTALNLDWNNTTLWQGILLVIILGVLQSSVCEFIVMSLATIVNRCRKPFLAVGDGKTVSCIINYNLLAMSKDDIDEAFKTMFHAYMLNLGPNVSAVLVSATKNKRLKEHETETKLKYRAKIYNILYAEGFALINGDYSAIDKWRLENFWMPIRHAIQRQKDSLHALCSDYSQHFMCIHRISTVLRKCGQYQDLMLLSQGDNYAWTYTDEHLYSNRARKYNELLFVENEDTAKILGIKYDYTMVLDGDTYVPEGAVQELLNIAAANPDSAILQPSIKLDAKPEDTLFMHLENIRQEVNTPVANAMARTLSQCGYYGKALINNRVYIEKVIGTREAPVERVPIDVLSHDTFEAAALKPMFVESVALHEAPSYNYVTWHIRELRWNKGEVLLAMHFWRRLVGGPMRLLQRCFQGNQWIRTRVRARTELDFITGYIAHSALRTMFMKPMLLAFIFLHIGARFHYPYLAIGVVMFFVIVFPKLAVLSPHNVGACVIDLIAGVIQFTPESIVGCVRLVRAIASNIVHKSNWTPQRVVEEEFRNSNPFVSSLKHLWGYMLTSAAAIILVAIFASQYFMLIFMLASVFVLPFFTGVTSLNKKLKRSSDASYAKRSNLSASNTRLSNMQALSDSLNSIPSIWSTQTPALVSQDDLLKDNVLYPQPPAAYVAPLSLYEADAGSVHPSDGYESQTVDVTIS